MRMKLSKSLSVPFDSLLRIPQIQKHVNYMFQKDGYEPVPIEGKYFMADAFWKISPYLDTIQEVLTTYKFDDIQNDDIVLDIGANIGAFSIMASRKARRVYAVEPIFGEIIDTNLKLNGINNVKVVEVALGEGVHELRYGR